MGLKQSLSRVARNVRSLLDNRTFSKENQSHGEELARLRRRLAATEAELAAVQAELAEREAPGTEAPAFFVVGQSKSGTGWLMKILDSHPEILCRGGGRFFGRHLRDERLKEMTAGGPVRAKTQPSSLHNAMLQAEYLRLWVERSVWSRDEDPDEHLANLTRLAIDYFLKRKLAQSGKRVVGDKTPLSATDIVGETSTIYPEAKVIHLLRDGRDVAVSRIHHRWKTARDLGGNTELEPEELAKREAFYGDPDKFLASGESLFLEERLRSEVEDWRTNVASAIEDGPALLGENYTEVRYEHLLERPETEAGRLLGFLAVDTDDATVRRCVEAASFEKRSGRQRGQENYDLNHGKHRKGIAGDWKNVFTEKDKAIFKEVAGDFLVMLGYEESNNW